MLKKELAALWPAYASYLCITLVAGASAYTYPFFTSKGLSLFDITLLFSVFTATILLFEIPTGAIADIYGRKASSILSFFIVGITLLLMPAMQTLFQFIVLYVAWGIGVTLSSGSIDAWLVDYLKDQKMIERYYLHSHSLGSIGFVLAPLIGAALMHAFGFAILWYVYGVGTFIGGAAYLLIPEQRKRRRASLLQLWKRTFVQSKNTIRYVHTNSMLSNLLISLFFVAGLAGMIGAFFQPYLTEKAIPLAYFGPLYSVIAIIGIITPFIIKWINTRIAQRTTVLISIVALIAAALIAMIGAASPYIGIPLFLFLIILVDIHEPVHTAFFQKHVPSKIRATAGSLRSIILSIAISISTMIGARIIDATGVQIVLPFIAVFSIPAFLAYRKIREAGE